MGQLDEQFVYTLTGGILNEQNQCVIDHIVAVVAGYSVQQTLYMYDCKHEHLSGMKLGEGAQRAVIFSAGPKGLEFCLFCITKGC